MKKVKWILVMLLCITFTLLASVQTQAQEIGQNLTLNPDSEYLFYSAYDENGAARTAKSLTMWNYSGANEGWLRSNTYAASDAYKWKAIATDTEGEYRLKNKASNTQVKADVTSLNNKEYAVSYKDATEGGAYRFIIKEKQENKYYVLIQSVTSEKYMIPDATDTTNHHIMFTETDSKAAYWCVEEVGDGRLPDAQVLWETITVENGVNIYYRIPAITTAGNGNIVAVTDKRYHNNNDLGNHQIDLLFRSSANNGKDWNESKNMTEGLTTATTGYGDAAIVADRESNKVLVICVGGSAGYFGSNPSNRITVNTFLSEDGGLNFSAPRDITDQIYALDDTWLGLFAGSGRMMQSRYIKVGEYYRIYTAISCRATNWNGSVNHVLYSDDFGENWHILGNTTMATAPVAPGDEPKVEELPNGDVVIAARKNYGRYINIFSYDKNDSTYTKGSWSTQADLGLGNCGGCDGETYFVYAKKKDTEEYVYLALQSIPTIYGRYGVGIFYKELGASDTTPQAYISGWGTDKFFMVQEGRSAYSTFSIQPNGEIAFFYEDSSPDYDMVYVPLTLSEITGGDYEMAFTGIGSKSIPYAVTTEAQVEAVTSLYIKEGVSWQFSEECKPWLKTALEERSQEAQTVYTDGGVDTERPSAILLNEKIQEAEALVGNDTATAEALFKLNQELVKAIDEYQALDELDSELAEVLARAEALYNSNELAEDRQAAIDLKSAIDTAKSEGDTADYAEVYPMITALTAAMEEYEAVAELVAKLEEKIQEAETLLASDKLVSERMETALLQEAVDQAKLKKTEGTFEELREVITVLQERMNDYRQASEEVFTVEARYNSVNIRVNAFTDVSSYKIFRSLQEDGEYEQIGTITVEEGKASYSYIDTTAGTGTRYWYKLEVLGEEGTESKPYAPIRDVYATGVEAVQKHAETGQYHKDFVAGNDTQFGGNRMVEATAQELARVAALEEGSLLISYKPANVNGKKAIFAIKQEGASVGAADLATNTGLVFYQNGGDIRLDAAGALKGNWSGAAPAGQWSTFGYVNRNYNGSDNNVLTSRNGTAALSYGRSDMDGFIAKNPDLTSMTIGAGKNGTSAASQFNGEIAYVTVTDEVFSAEELDAYTQAVNAALAADMAAPGKVTGLRAEAGNGEVVLSWTALTSGATGYEVSMDGGESWEAAATTTGHTFVGLENGKEYTFKVRAVNLSVKGEAETIAVIPEGEAAVPEKVETPVFSLEEGTYKEIKTVEISTATEGAVIYYTTDGTEPTQSSIEYTQPFTVDTTITLKAIAVKEGMESSEVATAVYTIEKEEPTEKERVKTPVFSLTSGTYDKAQSVTITTDTEGAIIYYTTNGTVPTVESTEYTGAITVDKTMTLKAIAVKEGMEQSEVVSAAYTIKVQDKPTEVEKVKQPVFSVAAGTYDKAQSVTITSATEGAAIYYTIDGKTPTTSSIRYSKAITVDKTMTIKAIAVKSGMNNSAVATAAYTIKAEIKVKPWIFTDVEQNGTWKHESVKYVYDNDIMGAVGASTEFQPDRPLSRS
ncbi:MAG: chitobiase/beta-hexosaminidase C-terminal domain-containing protein, partial [Lachnospiraceae bacterium]|nr:chitobiase/beta-hexosaminidase C-terminal domain-containing protein [Lachnospiraceae bacterium]